MPNQSQNIEILCEAFQDFFNHVISTKNLDINEFMNLMEPKFVAAGYRQNTPPHEGHQVKILIINDSGSGDFIVASGAIREIRRMYPNEYIVLLIRGHYLALAELCPYVDEIFIHDVSRDFNNFYYYFPHNIKQIPNLLEYKFDICYNFGHNQEAMFLSYMCGAMYRITYDREPLARKDYGSYPQNLPDVNKMISKLSNVILPRCKFGTHAVDVDFSLVDNMLEKPVENRELEIWYSTLDFTIAKNTLKNIAGKIYALCMSASTLLRHYPPEKYSKLVEKIFEEDPTATFIIIGGGQNDLISSQIFLNNLSEKYRKNILSIVGKANYRQTGAILKFCDMYIGNDTGQVQLAAAVKCPVLMVNCFPMDIPKDFEDVPLVYAPYRVPSVTVQPAHALPECQSAEIHYSYGCKSKMPHCITQIEPETIFKGFKILQERILEKNLETVFIS